MLRETHFSNGRPFPARWKAAEAHCSKSGPFSNLQDFGFRQSEATAAFSSSVFPAFTGKSAIRSMRILYHAGGKSNDAHVSKDSICEPGENSREIPENINTPGWFSSVPPLLFSDGVKTEAPPADSEFCHGKFIQETLAVRRPHHLKDKREGGFLLQLQSKFKTAPVFLQAVILQIFCIDPVHLADALDR